MILRQLMEHVRTQNWVAVALDFAIVVLGVFIGIQLGNWNEARERQQDYEEAVSRYVAEAQTNIETLDQLEMEVATSLGAMRAAFEALLTCTDTAENRALVEAGIIGISGTIGVALRTDALEDLTEQQRLLAEQSEERREIFSKTKFNIDLFLREAAFIETLPLDPPVQHNPIIDIGQSRDRNVTYMGVDYSREVRGLTLAVPLDVACRDDALKKSFYTWERWQGTLPVLIGILRTTLETSLEELDAS